MILPCELYLPDGKQRFWFVVDAMMDEVRLCQTRAYDASGLVVGRDVILRELKRGWFFTEIQAADVEGSFASKIVMFNSDADKIRPLFSSAG